MKKLILLVLAGIFIVTVSAQEKAVTTKITTVYDEFKPAVMSDDEEQQYPLVNYFFYELDGKIIKVHERIINNIISKEKRRKFKTVIMMPEFSWNDKECLIELLKAI